MSVMSQQPSLARPARSGTLYDVLELILDKGLVIDVYVRVSLVGIEILTIDARIVVASVDTYLRFAEAVNRLDLTQTKDGKTLDEFVGGMQEHGAHGKTKGALSGAKDAVSNAIHGDDDDDDRQPARRRSSSAPRRRRQPQSEDEG
ncbi:MAG TPA: gas vesicle structural protein GvpA [Mycobacteriales bacterium]|jgi:hypothetical protein